MKTTKFGRGIMALLLAIIAMTSACSSEDSSGANAQLNVERTEREGI